MKAVPDRAHTLATLIFILFGFGFTQAQSPKPTPTPAPLRPLDEIKRPGSEDERPLTTFEEEMRAKRAIKLAEKDHQENLSRAREIAQIGKELQESLKGKSSLDRTSLKRIERLEKLTKKIRGEAGGDDDEVNIPERPTDISSAAAQIAEASEVLSKDVQNTPRQVVSASVIGNANVLLELVKMLRAFVRQP
jgi:hypothetical protein